MIERTLSRERERVKREREREREKIMHMSLGFMVWYHNIVPYKKIDNDNHVSKSEHTYNIIQHRIE